MMMVSEALQMSQRQGDTDKIPFSHELYQYLPNSHKQLLAINKTTIRKLSQLSGYVIERWSLFQNSVPLRDFDTCWGLLNVTKAGSRLLSQKNFSSVSQAQDLFQFNTYVYRTAGLIKQCRAYNQNSDFKSNILYKLQSHRSQLLLNCLRMSVHQVL